MQTMRTDWPYNPLEELSEALDNEGVEHGCLKEWAPKNNLAMTDESKVFVKMSREGMANSANEVKYVQQLSKFIPMPKPALPHPLLVKDRICGVWEWQPNDNLLPEQMSRSFIQKAVGPLAILHNSTQNPELFPEIHSVPLAERIATRAKKYPPKIPQLAYAFERVINEIAIPFEAFVETRLDSCVITHGDPHLSNLLSVNHEPLWVDWESVAVCLPSWDIASMIISVRKHFPTGQTIDQNDIFATYEEFSQKPVDLEELHACLLAKSSTAMSFELLVPTHNESSLLLRVNRLLEEASHPRV